MGDEGEEGVAMGMGRGVDKRSKLRKGRDERHGKIVVVTESSVSYEMESQVGSKTDLHGERGEQGDHGHGHSNGEDFLEDASVEST